MPGAGEKADVDDGSEDGEEDGEDEEQKASVWRRDPLYDVGPNL
jgi:hypothetical protein